MTIIPCADINIIPVHLNTVFSDEYLSLHANLDQKRFSSIVETLSSDSLFILDFDYVGKTLSSDAIAAGALGILEKKILLINLDESLHGTLLGYFSDKLHDFEKDSLGYCLRTDNFPDDIKLPDLAKLHYLYKYLEEKCKETISPANEPRRISSNIYINKHFDLKSLFEDIDTVRIVVYLIARKLNKWEKMNKMSEYKLISSSFNGCILGNLLALVMGRDHISIPHLGPQDTKEDNRYLNYIESKDKFVYIYDLIALGNEQKTIKVITHLREAEIVYSLGVACFKPSRTEERTTVSLVDFKKMVGDVFIAADENEMKKLIGENNA